MRLAYTTYLDAIAEESDRLEDLAPRGLGKKVPSCPGWTLRQLLGHLAGVYEFWTTQLRGADPSARLESKLDHVEPSALAAQSDQLAAQSDQLVAALEEVGPQSPCWNWSGEELDASWVARRMALEAAVHRVDGELTVARPLPIDIELAIDGIDERLAVHLAKELSTDSTASLGGSICLICSDAPAAWVVEVDRGNLRWRHGRGPADTAVVGSASQLLLFTWNRVGPEVFYLTGDREVAGAWRRLPSGQTGSKELLW